MTLFRLLRVAKRKEGAFGVLIDLRDYYPFAVTLERTYDTQYNAFITKIPAGVYECFRDRYHRGNYDTWGIRVPNHEQIKFHKGNWETDLDGCPAIGEQYEVMAGRQAVAQSHKGFTEFMARTQGFDAFEIEVFEAL